MNSPTPYHQMINEYLELLSVSEEGIRIYVTLVEHGPLSFSSLSKLSGVERTKLYRIVDELVAQGIIGEMLDYKKRLFKASESHEIHRLVEQKKIQTESLVNNFSTFSDSVRSLVKKTSPTSVQFYRGQDGIRQMLWNELSAKGESLCFIYKIFDAFVGPRFFDHWSSEFTKRDLSSREIRTELFDQSFQECPNDICFQISSINMRYLPYRDFPLKHGLTIYDDVVAIYDFWEDEIFGVEMKNPRVADMQRIFFETFWKMAKPISSEELKKRTRRSNGKDPVIR